MTSGVPYVACVLVVAHLGVASAQQSLAAVAQQEAERRKAITKPAPIYTNKDLQPVAATESGSPLPANLASKAVPSADGARATPKDDSSDTASSPAVDSTDGAVEPVKAREKRDEKYWRERAALIRERLERLRADTVGIRERIATLQAAAESAAAAEAASLHNETSLANADLRRFATDLRHIEQEWRTFEHRAREANVPQEWLQRP